MGTEDASHETNRRFAQEALEKWSPRFIANGIDANDLERIEDEIEGWADWCAAFTDVGAKHAELGEVALDRGDEESAGEHLTRAAMYYHFGSHVWHEDAEIRSEAQATAVELYLRGGELLDPPVQRLEAPVEWEGFSIPGNLRVPEEGPDGTSGDSPLIVLLPGSDSIKEELDAYGETLLDRGLATLAIDGAGQGETWAHRGMSPNYPKLVSAVVDRVIELDPTGVDTSRLGVFGVSLGGFYAAHAAANEPRFDACVGISGKFTVGPLSTWATDLHRQQYSWACKTDSLVEVDEITEALTLRDDIKHLTAPSLMLTGARDVVTDPEQTRRIAERAPKGEFVCYEEGTHVCNNITYKARPYAADWLRHALS